MFNRIPDLVVWPRKYIWSQCTVDSDFYDYSAILLFSIKLWDYTQFYMSQTNNSSCCTKNLQYLLTEISIIKFKQQLIFHLLRSLHSDRYKHQINWFMFKYETFLEKVIECYNHDIIITALLIICWFLFFRVPWWCCKDYSSML